MISVFVPGKPAPQGSKSYKGHWGGKPVLAESSKAVKPWRADIREYLLERHSGAPLMGPLTVDLRFVMPRPTSTPKRSTPPAVKRPDLDKLVRAVFDAIGSAGVWGDDSQVTDLRTSKRIAEIGEKSGVEIVIRSGAVQGALL